jgi:hypothetical protein
MKPAKKIKFAPALDGSESELERGKRAAYNLAAFLSHYDAFSGRWEFAIKGRNYFVTAQVQNRRGGKIVAGPPAIEIFSKGEAKQAASLAKKVAQHLRRMAIGPFPAGSTFWKFPHTGTQEYVIAVVSNGTDELQEGSPAEKISSLRSFLEMAEEKAKARRRPRKTSRKRG